jgi:hypothetical protein
MALAQVQAALARLFTDEAARNAFLEDPQSSARALGLDDDDAATLAGLAPQAIRRFAGGLAAKRVLDARKMTPLTARVLGPAFAEHFHAATAPLAPGAGRVAQARALAERLAAAARAGAVAPEWIGDLARYEAAFVEASHRWFGVRLLLFRFPIGAIASQRRGERPIDAPGRQATFGVWARTPGGRLLHRVWPSS